MTPKSAASPGFVIETMFGAVDADVYVMADGDGTYPAKCVHQLIEPVLKHQCDMAVGARLSDHTDDSFRKLHVFGNRLVRFCINRIMDADLKDIMSGYRVFNRKITKKTKLGSRSRADFRLPPLAGVGNNHLFIQIRHIKK